jgi:hypothetical protein
MSASNTIPGGGSSDQPGRSFVGYPPDPLEYSVPALMARIVQLEEMQHQTAPLHGQDNAALAAQVRRLESQLRAVEHYHEQRFAALEASLREAGIPLLEPAAVEKGVVTGKSGEPF